MKDIETQLISHELGMGYLRPITYVMWKQRVWDTLALLAAIAGVVLFFAAGGAILARFGIYV